MWVEAATCFGGLEIGRWWQISRQEYDKSYSDCFRKAESLEKILPNCIAVEELDEDSTLVTFSRIKSDQDEQTQYIFSFIPGEEVNNFEVSWKGTDPNNLISIGRHLISLKPDGDEIIINYNSQIDLTMKGRAIEGHENLMAKLNTEVFENAIALLQDEEAEMADEKSQLDEVIQNAEDAVMELEHEAEEAAASGFLGGAQMWGWIALGVIVLILIVFFR